jgi:peptidoglycan/xylan/chitin deacetylase (PgdA/CDA1 family)
MKTRATLLLLAALLTFRTASAEPTAVILCYHIVESPSDSIFTLSRETFRQQMTYLKTAGFEVIPLQDLVDYMNGTLETIPENSVVITVDDGWRSTYTEFYPELKRQGFPATMYIYPRYIGAGHLALTWDQVREMADDGYDIQSHTLSHPFLGRAKQRMAPASYIQWLDRELRESKRLIEQEVGRPVRHLAYPYGDYNRTVMERARLAGYDSAVITESGPIRRGDDVLQLRRFAITRETSFDEYRRRLGASRTQVAATSPAPGSVLKSNDPVISARLVDFEKLDPRSVGMAVLEQGLTPFSYNPSDGTISLVVRDQLEQNHQQVVVWGRDARTGQRVEASWSFYAHSKPPPPRPRPVAPVPPPALETPAVEEIVSTVAQVSSEPAAAAPARVVEAAPGSRKIRPIDIASPRKQQEPRGESNDIDDQFD